MLKRDHRDEIQEQPTTPTAETKKPRESGSLQDLRTPLKTSNGSILAGSTSLDFISPRRPEEEDEERRKNRAELVKKQQENKEALRSPVSGASPRAEPLSSTLKRSTSIENGSGNFGSSPSLLSAQTAQETRSILTASKSRLSLSTTRLNSISIQPPTAEQMTKSFDEWMKMAADNKINSKNSWSFALIDYFSELTFLRDGDSINFQKASCTLDGCVKIYASRVDSVVNETTKLLNGLSDKSNKFKEEDEGEGEEDDDAGSGSLNTVNNLKSSKAKKTSLRTVETIEKNPENLILKNFDLEFAIDPLFKKTSAEFDESGTKGALLKNLECSPIDNLIIFDSSDQIQMDFSIPPDFIEQNIDETIDISLLSSIFGGAIIDLDKKSLCPTFDNYNFNQSLADIRGTLDKLSRITAEIPEKENVIASYADNGSEDEDEVVGGKHYHDDFDIIMPNDDGADYYEDEIESNHNNHNITEKTVKWASNNDVSDETGLSYFDGAFKQTWAGPEHWKIRKSQRIPSVSNNNNSSENIVTGKSRRASKVEKVAIDFINSVIDFHQIFSKPSTSNQISLSKSSILERNENDHLLPDDLHFSSGSLLKLFIKPTWKMTKTTNKQSVRTTRSSSKSSEMLNEGNFVERNFWISQENHQNGIFEEIEVAETAEISGAYDDDDDGLYDDYYEDVSPMGPIEPDIQEHDTALVAENEEGHTNGNFPVDFNTNLVAAPKFTYTAQLNYARVAKRVDVAKLKATLWNEFVDGSKRNNKPAKHDQLPQQNGSFSALMNNLSHTYPSEALAEVSVPYCFICLLHLANENNLEIKAEGNDLIIRS